MASKISLQDAHRQGFVLGLDSVSGVHPRRELDELMTNDPDVFNLYILALARITTTGDIDDNMGYFRIAGIHGLPRIDWDDVKVPGVKGQGSYCQHGSYLFPSWHRPYLAMMEQTLYISIEAIAGEFKDLKYKEAAKRFRLPYWDWIKPRAHRRTTFPGQGADGKTVEFPYNYDMPEVLQRAKLKVCKPGGDETKLVDIDNPFLTYYFPEKGGLREEEWNDLDDCDDKAKPAKIHHLPRNRTVRNALGSSKMDDFTKASKTLNMLRESSVEQALHLISPKYDKYLDFAAEKPRLKRDNGGEVLRDKDYKPFVVGPHGSLEDIHNRYHDIVGGHMGRVPVASFDPIFWLHHGNIDRMFSVWQATHNGPESYLPDGKDHIQNDGSGGYGKDVPLRPFRSGPTKEDFWTSAMVKDPERFGYTYADVQGQEGDILRRWNLSYRWSLQSSSSETPPEWMEPIDVSKAQALRGTKDDGGPPFMCPTKRTPVPIVEKCPVMAIPDVPVPEVQELLSVVKGNVELVVQWYIDTQVERHALNGSFTILYFIGNSASMAAADADPSSYSTAPILAGLTKVFTAPREACDACQRSSSHGAVATGSSAIAPILRDYVAAGKLEGLAPAQVVPFLRRKLHWRIVDVNQQRYRPADVRGLRVGVSSTLSLIRDSVMVDWRPYKHPEVTDGGESARRSMGAHSCMAKLA